MKKKTLIRVNLPSFSLIEVVFVIAIFMLLIAGMLSLVNLSSKNLLVSQHRLQAANLAREGLEIAREARDTAWLQSPPKGWYGLPGTGTMNDDCWLPESTTSTDFKYPTSACGGHLGLTSGSDFPPFDNVTYTRSMTVTTSGDIRKIMVTVQWDDFGRTIAGGNPYTVTMVTYLTNWKKS
jgi:type II secretory pathway pseudopilin PulG